MLLDGTCGMQTAPNLHENTHEHVCGTLAADNPIRWKNGDVPSLATDDVLQYMIELPLSPPLKPIVRALSKLKFSIGVFIQVIHLAI